MSFSSWKNVAGQKLTRGFEHVIEPFSALAAEGVLIQKLTQSVQKPMTNHTLSKLSTSSR